MCVSEHWLSGEGISWVLPTNFSLSSYFSRTLTSHGGVAIYLNKLLLGNTKTLNIDYIENLSVENHIEMCATSVKINEYTLGITVLYRPPCGNLQIFFNNLSLCLNYLTVKYNYVILCGDFNIDNFSSSFETNMLNDIFDCYSLRNTLSEPSRVFTNVNGVTTYSAIDYMVTNLPSGLYKVDMIQEQISDHYAQKISVITNNEPSNNESTIRSYRDLSEENILKFRHSIAKSDWNSVYTEDIDAAFNNFMSVFTHVMESCCPIVSFRSNGKKEHGKPWITPEIVEESNNLKNLYWMVHNVDNTLLTDYKEKKHALNVKIKNLKKQYYGRRIAEASNKSREIWNIVNNTLDKSKRNNEIVKLNIDGTVIDSPAEICEQFASFFSTIVQDKMKSHFGNTTFNNCTLGPHIGHTLYVRPVDETEVMGYIRNLNNTKSCGPDGIPTKLLKTVADLVAEPISYLFNLSIREGCFPSVLKLSKIIPIFKRGDKHDCASFRPISILSVFSKLFERIMCDQVIQFLDKHRIIAEEQHGFRTQKSTTTASIEFLQTIYEGLDRGNEMAALFFDLSCAFDTLNTRFILDKLSNYGIRGQILDWFASFLTNRKMAVTVSGKDSEERSISLGVPQGSVIGPLIFILYINDLPFRLRSAHITMYADDTSMVVSAQNGTDLASSIDKVIKDFAEWCRTNGLMLNISKTECIYFSKRKSIPPTVQDLLYKHNLKPADHVKFLGSIIDKSLEWNHQIDAVCKKINKGYFAILRLKTELSTEYIINIYYALIYSHLSYNIILWGQASQAQRVFYLQKRVIRLMFGLKARESCRPFFIRHKLLTLPSLYIYENIKYIRKNLHHFETNKNVYNTRHQHLLKMSKPTHAYFKKAPHYASAEIYNALPESIKNIRSDTVFLKKLKSLLYTNCFYDLNTYFIHMKSLY